MLEHLRHLEIPGAVRPRLDHRHELRPEIELRAEVIEVVDHGIEIDLQHRRVALARQGMGQLLEAVLPGPFQQHGTSRHGPAADAGDALVGRGEKFLVAVEQRGVAFQFGSDADQRVDARPRDHPGHAAVQFVVRQSALRDVRQHECPAARQRHVVQVIQRQRQRIEIEVVGVVDEHRVVDAVLDLQPHGDLGGLGERRRGIAHRRAERLDELGVAARRLVADHRLGNLRARRGVAELPFGEPCGDHASQRLVITMINDGPGPVGEDHLFVAFLLQIEEVLLMRVADRGEDHHVGTDDPLQPLHLPGLRDARLDQRQLLVALDHQHRQRHAQLRIVTLGRAIALHPCGQLLGDPLLDDGLAVRPGDAHDRAFELRPVVGRQALQGRDGVRNRDVPASGQGFDAAFGEERPHPAHIHLRDIVVRIVVGAAHGDEHRSGAQLARQRTAVGHHRLHLAVRARELAAHDGGDLRKQIFHKMPKFFCTF